MLMLPGKKICYYMPLSAEMPTPTKLGRDLDQTKVRTRSLLNKFMHRCNFKLAIFGLFDHNLPFSSLKGMALTVFIYYDGMPITDWFFTAGHSLRPSLRLLPLG